MKKNNSTLGKCIKKIMNLTIVALILVYLHPIELYSTYKRENITYDISTIAENLDYCTTIIRTENKGHGTGFFFLYTDSDSNQYPFLVTNKHVIDSSKTCTIYFNKSEAGSPILGQMVEYVIDDNNLSWIRDEKYDLAILPLSDILRDLDGIREEIISIYINNELVPSESTLCDIDAIESVIFIGYPASAYDDFNNIPIFREGITATPYNLNYKNRKEFLIDASVFNGSSGSPVFIYQKGTHSNKYGTAFLPGDRLMFLGIIWGTFNRKADGDWKYVEIPTICVPFKEVNEKINLAVCVKSDVLIELIEKSINDNTKK